MSPERLARLDAVAAAGALPAQPSATFAAVHEALAALVGHRLMSVMRLLPERMELVRLYSSDSQSYPAGARKSKAGLPWAELVLQRGEPFLGRSEDDLRWAFDDADKLISLGVGSVINHPILWNGRVLGTLNILDRERHYDERAVAIAGSFAPLLRPVLIEAAYQPSA